MKYALFSVILLFNAYISTAQEQLPNSSFEHWSDQYTANNWISSFTYGSWIFHTAIRSDDAIFGNYAAKLYSQTIYVYHIPAFLILGDLDLNTGITITGKPFNSKPNAVSIFIKFKPKDTDDYKITSYLTLWNNNNHRRDTIAFTDYYLKTNHQDQDYQQLILPFYYNPQLINFSPDSIQFIIMCSTSEEFSHDSTFLFIDSLRMIYDTINLPTKTAVPTQITDTSFIAHWYALQPAQSYLLDIATDSNFTNIIPQYHNLQVDSTKLKIILQHKGSKYFYRVRVMYENQISDYSNVMPVVMATKTQALPPTDITPTGFSARWKSQPNAKSYLLDVAHDRNFSIFVSDMHNKELKDTAFYVDGLSPKDSIFYRVRVKYIHNAISDYSDTIALKTAPLKVNNHYKINIKNNDNILTISGKNIIGKNIEIYDFNGKKIISIPENYKNFVSIPLQHSKLYLIKIFDKQNLYMTKNIFIK